MLYDLFYFPQNVIYLIISSSVQITLLFFTNLGPKFKYSPS